MEETFERIRLRLFNFLTEENNRENYDAYVRQIAKDENVSAYEVYAQLSYLAGNEYIDRIFFIDNIPYSLHTTVLTDKGRQYFEQLQN